MRRDIEIAKVFVDTFLASGVKTIASARDPRLAFWFSALVSYGRAFGSGVRHADRPDNGLFNKHETEAHEYFLNLRDKYVAHAVNDYERTIALAYITNSSFSNRKITRVGQTHVELAWNQPELPTVLSALCEKQITDLNSRIVGLHRKVRSELNTIGIDAVYALPDLDIPNPDHTKVSKGRK